MATRKNYQIGSILKHLEELGVRFVEEPSYSEHERIGKMLQFYGVSCTAAAEIDCIEAEMKCSLLNLYPLDYKLYASKVKAVLSMWRDKTADVLLYKKRDFQKYPKLTEGEIGHVRDNFKWVEMLTQGMANITKFDPADYAYKMYDIIEMALSTIWQKLCSLTKDLEMLTESFELRMQRWFRMEDKYKEECWGRDRKRFLQELEQHIRMYGDSKESLETFLRMVDLKATDRSRLGMLAILNEHHINEDRPVAYIFKNRNLLTPEQIMQYQSFKDCRELLIQRIELCDLKQPAMGAYADLFANRAAQELAIMLAPTMATYVDFRHGYQYAAWDMAMMDLGLVNDVDKRYGSQLLTFVNKYLLKGGDEIKSPTSITPLLSKKMNLKFGQITEENLGKTAYSESEYEKLKDCYWHCLSIANKVMQKDLSKLGLTPYLYIEHANTPEIEDFVNQTGEGFMERIRLLKTAFD